MFAMLSIPMEGIVERDNECHFNYTAILSEKKVWEEFTRKKSWIENKVAKKMKAKLRKRDERYFVSILDAKV